MSKPLSKLNDAITCNHHDHVLTSAWPRTELLMVISVLQHKNRGRAIRMNKLSRCLWARKKSPMVESQEIPAHRSTWISRQVPATTEVSYHIWQAWGLAYVRRCHISCTITRSRHGQGVILACTAHTIAVRRMWRANDTRSADARHSCTAAAAWRIKTEILKACVGVCLVCCIYCPCRHIKIIDIRHWCCIFSQYFSIVA